MSSLLKEFASGLAKSDSSDAGKTDVQNKTAGDIKFSLMRNTINSDGQVTGSGVANYLERAGELNDDVETVVYGLQDSDGDIVKVYVNATQADAFEIEMKKMLGMEDDIEEAINDLATRFDIVDVVWPKGQGPADSEEESDEVDLEDNVDIGDPDLDRTVDPEDDDDDLEVIASADDDAAAAAEPESSEEEPEEEPQADAEDKPVKKTKAAPEEPESEEEQEKPAKKDSKHDKLSGVGNKMKVKEEARAQGANMSIGDKFLTRVLAEAKEDRDGVVDGYDIRLDAQQQAMAQKLRSPLPKKIIQLFSVIGIPGNKLNSAGAEESVSEASEMLRANLSVRRAFTTFFDLMATAYGKKISAEPEAVQEAKLKRGNYLQKQLETVLVKLGLPEALVSTTGPGVVGSALYRASKMVEDSADLKAALRLLAVRMGIKPADAMAPLEEAVDPMGADMYADAVMSLVATLGVPDTAFARNARMILAREFRETRKSTNVSGLINMVKQFEARFATAKVKARVTRDEMPGDMGTTGTR